MEIACALTFNVLLSCVSLFLFELHVEFIVCASCVIMIQCYTSDCRCYFCRFGWVESCSLKVLPSRRCGTPVPIHQRLTRRCGTPAPT